MFYMNKSFVVLKLCNLKGCVVLYLSVNQMCSLVLESINYSSNQVAKEAYASYSPRQKSIIKKLKGYLSFTIALEAPLLLLGIEVEPNSRNWSNRM